MEKGKVLAESSMKEARKLVFRQMEVIKRLGKEKEFILGEWR